MHNLIKLLLVSLDAWSHHIFCMGANESPTIQPSFCIKLLTFVLLQQEFLCGQQFDNMRMSVEDWLLFSVSQVYDTGINKTCFKVMCLNKQGNYWKDKLGWKIVPNSILMSLVSSVILHLQKWTTWTVIATQLSNIKSNLLTIWNTSDPSSKSTIAKNSLLEYIWEYRNELATIVNSSLACLKKN